MQLAAIDVRVEAPIPGKAAIGVEVPNKHRDMVVLRDIIESGRSGRRNRNWSLLWARTSRGRRWSRI